jgi:hypothetical protein
MTLGLKTRGNDAPSSSQQSYQKKKRVFNKTPNFSLWSLCDLHRRVNFSAARRGGAADTARSRCGRAGWPCRKRNTCGSSLNNAAHGKPFADIACELCESHRLCWGRGRHARPRVSFYWHTDSTRPLGLDDSVFFSVFISTTYYYFSVSLFSDVYDFQTHRVRAISAGLG